MDSMHSSVKVFLLLSVLGAPVIDAGPATDCWVSTIFDETFCMSQVRLASIVYIGFQLEECPTSGALHMQGFVLLRDKSQREHLAHLLGQPWASNGKYIDGVSRKYMPMVGMCLHSLQYCSSYAYCQTCHCGTHLGLFLNKAFCGYTGCLDSEDKHKLGAYQSHGSIDLLLERDRIRDQSAHARILELVQQMLADGCSDLDIIENFGVWYSRNYRLVAQLRVILAPQRVIGDNSEPSIYWLHGVTGTHKSRIAHSIAPMRSYKKSTENSWWCGYSGQPLIIFEELRKRSFDGDFSMLLKLTDRYPAMVQTKGGQAFLGVEVIIITSSLSPTEMWGTIGRGPEERC